MKIAKSKKKHIFCIEGDWSHDMRDESSIKTALDFLKHNPGKRTGKINHIHRKCINKEGFKDLLQESCYKKYDRYSILYLASHGKSRKLLIGKKNIVLWEEMMEFLEGKAKNKIIHFGSCETLSGLRKKELVQFLEKTGALAISGYDREIPFIDSTFLDMFYFNICQQYQKMYLIERDMKTYYGQLCNEMGFKMIYEP